MNELKEVQWTKDDMVEVNLKEPDDFLKVRETLTRIGVASRKEKKLYQSCHILHKKGQYYIVHFKELFALDGKKANLSENDVQNCMGFSSKLRFSLFGIFLCGFSAELVEMLDERLTVFCPNQQFVRASQKVSFPSSKI